MALPPPPSPPSASLPLAVAAPRETAPSGLVSTAAAALPTSADPPPPPVPWWKRVAALYDVEADPREQHDLQHDLPELVQELLAKLIAFNASTAKSIHEPSSSAGKDHANKTNCISPWQGVPEPAPTRDLAAFSMVASPELYSK